MYADFETFTTSGKYNAAPDGHGGEDGSLERIKHKEFLLCYAEDNGETNENVSLS